MKRLYIKLIFRTVKNIRKSPSITLTLHNFCLKNNDKKCGLKVLSAIADLEFENEELYKLLAYKLKQAEAYDKEHFVAEKVLEWRPLVRKVIYI